MESIYNSLKKEFDETKNSLADANENTLVKNWRIHLVLLYLYIAENGK